MVIRNQSSYPTDEVKALVKFGAGRVSLKDVLVIVKHTQRPHVVRYSGTAYPEPAWSELPKSCNYKIILRLGTTAFEIPEKPWKRHEGAGVQFPEMTADTWQEALVLITAHEAKHIDQYRDRHANWHEESYRRKGERRRRGARSSEVACEHYAKFMVEQYREKGV